MEVAGLFSFLLREASPLVDVAIMVLRTATTIVAARGICSTRSDERCLPLIKHKYGE